MRILTGFGALLFAYLALIPVSLVGSLLDSACAGAGCERSLPLQILLGVLYAACLLAVLATAAALIAYTVTGSPSAQRRIGSVLGATAAVVFITLFTLFAIAFPLGAAICAGVAALALGGSLLANRQRPGPRASSNGHRPGGPAPSELERTERPGG